MVSLIIILAVVMVVDQIISRFWLQKKYPDRRNPDEKFLNRLHKYGERTIYVIAVIVSILAISALPQLRPTIFIGMGLLFVFRAAMERRYAASPGSYIHSVITSSLMITGGLIYTVFFY